MSEKYNIEYVFDKGSRNSLWGHISTPAGLTGWFADEVAVEGEIYTFIWHKVPAEARLEEIIPNTSIRFHWLEDENPESFFELKIHPNDLTGALMLEITDFAEKDEIDDAIILWETQVKTLKRALGL
ncbi:MAG: hypothetical protein LBR13_01520 [Dysgonamonadaceae bacterium]|jgi:uncharacterized protein YndB with AHSA1/START domain|nr:hypothetical protein [Dysgonamonadaceae bacterium]